MNTNATTYGNGATTTDMPTIAELIAGMKEMKDLCDQQRRSRDRALRAINDQGYIAFAVEGMGEAWVVDGRIIEQLSRTIDTATDGYLPIAGKMTGIRLIRASEYMPPLEKFSMGLFGREA